MRSSLLTVLLRSGRERLTQLFQSPVSPDSGSPFRDAAQLADLRVREVVEAPQDQHLPATIGESIQGLAQLGEPWIGRFWRWRRIRGIDLGPVLPLPPSAAQEIETRVSRDPQHPGAERAPSGVRTPVSEHAKEGLLHGVGGVVRITQHSVGESEQIVVVAVEHETERFAVTIVDGSYERLIARLGHEITFPKVRSKRGYSNIATPRRGEALQPRGEARAGSDDSVCLTPEARVRCSTVTSSRVAGSSRMDRPRWRMDPPRFGDSKMTRSAPRSQGELAIRPVLGIVGVLSAAFPVDPAVTATPTAAQGVASVGDEGERRTSTAAVA